MHIGSASIGEMIRILRIERGLSREELAERAQISRSHMNKIEAGIKLPGINTYQRIMEILNVDITVHNVNETEKEKYISKISDILMGKSTKEVKFIMKILQSIVYNLDEVC